VSPHERSRLLSGSGPRQVRYAERQEFKAINEGFFPTRFLEFINALNSWGSIAPPILRAKENSNLLPRSPRSRDPSLCGTEAIHPPLSKFFLEKIRPKFSLLFTRVEDSLRWVQSRWKRARVFFHDAPAPFGGGGRTL
jgi:hypothetical protein